MTRKVMIVGLVATFVLTLGGFGLAIPPAEAAKMMEADEAMMKATGEDLMKLKQELAAIQADLQKLTARIGSMGKMMEKTVGDYCNSVPESLLTTGFAPGLCRR